ncbi:hypothetical protein Voja6_00226 [Pseudomonas phage vB_PpuM-Voja-6]
MTTPLTDSELQMLVTAARDQMADVITRHLRTVLLPQHTGTEAEQARIVAEDSGIDLIQLVFLLNGDSAKLSTHKLLEIAIRLRLRPVFTLT